MKKYFENLVAKLKFIALKTLVKLGFIEDIFYINGPETLPPPLNTKEEKEIMKKLMNGDESCRETLMVRNLRLVVYIAKKFDPSGATVEDLISIGTVGLIKAVNTFKPEKNIKLATYASRCIENEILMYLRKGSQNRNEMSIDEPLNVDWDGNKLLLSDILGSDEDIVSKEIEREMEFGLLLNAVLDLSERDKNIMELRFGLNKKQEHTQRQVADLLGISQSYISRLEKRIIWKLKKDLERVC
ncbi:MAG: RNA polymerase sporulation sigma factor SigE [Oscillospiraceae bacterium]|jgi:RNA polymerase sporulation-specific sigma factor|nr:RNA polymerase sporulation sigma factor SigE [Oscillospiraceae bacterium]